MEIFYLTLTQMLVLFSLILVGLLLRKKRILPENSSTVMSKMETHIFLPALNLLNMLNNCSRENFAANSNLILYGAALVISAALLSYPISRILVRNSESDSKKEYLRNIYKYAFTFGNYGFIGNAVVLGVWGDEMLFKYTMFTFVATFICNSWGLYIMIPKEKNSDSIFKTVCKGIFSPAIIAMILGMIIGFMGIEQYVPEFAKTTLSNASACMGPVAMLLAGFVIGGYEFRNLFKNPSVYIMTALRLIIIPSIMAIILKICGASDEIITLSIIAFATPVGLNTIVFPAAYDGDTMPGASMATISHMLSVISIPLMYLVYVVLL